MLLFRSHLTSKGQSTVVVLGVNFSDYWVLRHLKFTSREKMESSFFLITLKRYSMNFPG